MNFNKSLFFTVFFILISVFSCRNTENKHEKSDKGQKETVSRKADCRKIAETYIPCIQIKSNPDIAYTYSPKTPGIPVLKTDNPKINIIVFAESSSEQTKKIFKEIKKISDKNPGRISAFLKPVWWKNKKSLKLSVALIAETENPFEVLAGTKKISVTADEKSLNYLINERNEIENFGINMQIGSLILVNGKITAPEDLNTQIKKVLAGNKTTENPKPYDKLLFTSRKKKISKYIDDFEVLCKTKSDWKDKIDIIKKCMKQSAECKKLKSCISEHYYDLKFGNAYKSSSEKESVKELKAYLDYGCPFCSMVYFNLKKFLANHKSIKFNLKLHPLNSHPQAEKAALIALLIKQKKGETDFLKFSDDIFHFQGLITLNYAKILAGKYGISEKEADAALKNTKFQAELNENVNFREELNAEGVPLCGIGGHYFEGLISEKFMDYLVKKLNKIKQN